MGNDTSKDHDLAPSSPRCKISPPTEEMPTGSNINLLPPIPRLRLRSKSFKAGTRFISGDKESTRHKRRKSGGHDSATSKRARLRTSESNRSIDRPDGAHRSMDDSRLSLYRCPSTGSSDVSLESIDMDSARLRTSIGAGQTFVDCLPISMVADDLLCASRLGVASTTPCGGCGRVTPGAVCSSLVVDAGDPDVRSLLYRYGRKRTLPKDLFIQLCFESGLDMTELQMVVDLRRFWVGTFVPALTATGSESQQSGVDEEQQCPDPDLGPGHEHQHDRPKGPEGTMDGEATASYIVSQSLYSMLMVLDSERGEDVERTAQAKVGWHQQVLSGFPSHPYGIQARRVRLPYGATEGQLVTLFHGALYWCVCVDCLEKHDKTVSHFLY
ncbi:hypothetical protein [Mollivirus kamchatka]|nr:hypothetical protein [Mollivirus kamchatka]